ncbi:hypothetical protein [Acinetobacter bohemicus]|uniref:hypothetical protein n=1 Tax=Acinetobacter bohemicus TaxID=1435036 RepID=UPI003FA1F15F
MDTIQGKYVLSTYYRFYVHFFYMLFPLSVDGINYLKSCVYKKLPPCPRCPPVQEYVAVEDAESIELKLPLNDAAFANKQDEFYCLFDKIRANLYQIQTLENLRDTLLPKLMSGEVRVQYQTEEVA